MRKSTVADVSGVLELFSCSVTAKITSKEKTRTRFSTEFDKFLLEASPSALVILHM